MAAGISPGLRAVGAVLPTGWPKARDRQGCMALVISLALGLPGEVRGQLVVTLGRSGFVVEAQWSGVRPAELGARPHRPS